MSNLLKCSKCPEMQFKSQDSLTRHVYEYHCDECTITVSFQGESKKIMIKRNENGLPCSNCKRFFNTRQNLKTHFNKSACQESFFKSACDQIPQENGERTTKRTYENSILSACGALSHDKNHQHQTLKLVDAMNLKPVCVSNSMGEENFLLIHEKRWTNICNDGMMSITPVVKKRVVEEPVNIDIGLRDIISNGPYSKSFLKEDYIEMNEKMTKLLNDDWSTFPHIRFSCAALLSGMVITNHNKAIIVNCNEVYGRTKPVDEHHEGFIIKKGIVPTSSLPPPPQSCRYDNVWITSIDDDHGRKLILGTKTFNSLSTSSLRLDILEKPDVGPTTSGFGNCLDPSIIKIFINRQSWKTAEKLYMNQSNQAIHNYDSLYQLRQLQTKFDKLSTYSRCRAASVQTDNHICQPYTIFTFANCDNTKDDSDGRVMSLVFREIALSIIRQQDNGIDAEDIVGSLEKAFLESMILKCLNDGKTKRILKTMTELYEHDTSSIQIIGNNQLNNHLETLAELLCPYLCRANKHIADAIIQTFPTD